MRVVAVKVVQVRLKVKMTVDNLKIGGRLIAFKLTFSNLQVTRADRAAAAYQVQVHLNSRIISHRRPRFLVLSINSLDWIRIF